MEVVISLPEDLFEEIVRVAERLGKSRDELFAEALLDYLRGHDSGSVIRRLNEVVDELSPTEDRFVTATTRSVFEQLEW